jgi:hypothetical protein
MFSSTTHAQQGPLIGFPVCNRVWRKKGLSPQHPHKWVLSLPRSCLEMLLWLLWLLLLLLLFLLPMLTMIGKQTSHKARLSWLASLQHRVAWRALAWAAAWQRRRLEHSTLHVGQSQQQALTWCLQGLRCPIRGSTGVFSRVWGSDPKRKQSHRIDRFQNLNTRHHHPLWRGAWRRDLLGPRMDFFPVLGLFLPLTPQACSGFLPFSGVSPVLLETLGKQLS